MSDFSISFTLWLTTLNVSSFQRGIQMKEGVCIVLIKELKKYLLLLGGSFNLVNRPKS